MKTKILLIFLFTFLFVHTSFSQSTIEVADSNLYKKAVELAKKYTIIDTHIDLPIWLDEEWFDLSVKSNKGDIDYIRAMEGGMDVGFMAIYTSPSLEGTGKSKAKADTLIDIVYKIESTWPDKFKVVKSPGEIENNLSKGKLLLAMGMENGSPIENKLDNLRTFYDKGIRYITLAHYKWNHICDSANDPEKKWNGLSPFGEQVVKEMNKLGMMIDCAHVSDSTVYDVLRISRAPIVVTHTGCRYFVPGSERNVSDNEIKLIAQKGGIIQIGFGSFFLVYDSWKAMEDNEKAVQEFAKNNNLDEHSKEVREFSQKIWLKNPMKKAYVKDVVDHIDHIVKLVGVDYVGIGSDYNGIGDGSIVVGLEDVSKFPNLIYELLSRGYSNENIQKIMGGNFLRVWKNIDKVAKNLR
ncbi:MAG TPA: dipeptidase [Ignavibacteriaceae bacterium]|nr:dipeptidase [Ignavibacteriaceae bacterium]